MLVMTVAVSDFGWGSVGKLRLILDELNRVGGAKVQIVAEPDCIDLLRRVMPGRVEQQRIDGQHVDLGLVVNDPVRADSMWNSGIPVVYVDSLPYLWKLPAEVPRTVEFYCAQRYPQNGLLLDNGPLKHRSDITWIDPIVPQPQARTGNGGIVIAVGGLHSHLSQHSVMAYQEVVVIPLARMLVRSGHRIAAICGNLDHRIVCQLNNIVGADVAVGPYTAVEFEEALVDARLLFTSPGSTTILQAAAMKVPTALLPPQNLSQILNVEVFSTPSVVTAAWPASVIDRNRVEDLRPFGEDVVLHYVYQSIVDAANSLEARLCIERTLERCLDFAADPCETLTHLSALGHSGARDIAGIIAGRLDAARVRQIRAGRGTAAARD